jgi:hypothetical protein
MSLQTVESSRAMHDPHNLNTIRKEPVKDQVVTDGPMAELWGDVWSRATETGVLGQQSALTVDLYLRSRSAASWSSWAT